MNTFVFNCEYPMGYIYMVPQDIEYIRDKVRTYRALHNEDLSSNTGRYYESAVTMIDLMQMIIQSHLNLCPTAVCVRIDPVQASELSFTADMVLHTMDPNAPLKHTLQFDMVFVDGAEEDDPGFYKIMVKCPGHNHSTSIGRLKLSDYALSHECPYLDKYPEMADIWVFPANIHAMRYCENFPTPSIFINMVSAAIHSLLDQINATSTTVKEN